MEYGSGMQQVPTQVKANCVERWSFVSMGEEGVEEADYMHYKREINYRYYDYENCYILLYTKMFNFYVPLQYYRTNSLHDRGKMCQPCHPAGSIMVNPV